MCRFIQIKSARLKIKTKNNSTKLPESQFFYLVFKNETITMIFTQLLYPEKTTSHLSFVRQNPCIL